MIFDYSNGLCRCPCVLPIYVFCCVFLNKYFSFLICQSRNLLGWSVDLRNSMKDQEKVRDAASAQLLRTEHDRIKAEIEAREDIFVEVQIHFFINPFLPTVSTFAVRETDVPRHNGGTTGAPLKPLRDDSALSALSSLRGLRGHPRFPHYAERRQSLGQQMLERWAKLVAKTQRWAKMG